MNETLLAQLEKLHERILMLETNKGLGAVKSEEREIYASKYTPQSLAVEILNRLRSWVPEEAITLYYKPISIPSRDKIIKLESFILQNSIGILQDDLDRAVKNKKREIETQHNWSFPEYYYNMILDMINGIYTPNRGRRLPSSVSPEHVFAEKIVHDIKGLIENKNKVALERVSTIRQQNFIKQLIEQNIQGKSALKLIKALHARLHDDQDIATDENIKRLVRFMWRELDDVLLKGNFDYESDSD
jgi:hypothetical protein